MKFVWDLSSCHVSPCPDLTLALLGLQVAVQCSLMTPNSEHVYFYIQIARV